MPTSPAQQIPDAAVDSAGLSVSTATPSAADGRLGAVYDPLNLAAAVPVHFHPTTSRTLGGDNYLMLNRRRWTSATVSGTDPGSYTAHTVDNVPSWVELNAATGRSLAINSGYTIPMNTANDSRNLNAAASRGPDQLWTLNEVTVGATTSAVVQRWHYNTALNVMGLQTEETIPLGTDGGDTVVFSQGVRWSLTTASYLYFYGTGPTGKVYSARKPWSRVGYVGTPTSPINTQWEVFTGTGWSPDFTTAKPVQTTSSDLVSIGPLSFANYAMQKAGRGASRSITALDFVATVQASGSDRVAQVYSSLGGRPWTPLGDPIPLGTVGTTYQGANIAFQPHVGPNPTMIDSLNSAGAVPWVRAVGTGGGTGITVDWSLLQIPRVT